MSNSGPGNVAGPSGVKGASPGLKAPHLTATESQELLKPLVFGNYQRHFRIFSAIVSAGIALHGVPSRLWTKTPCLHVGKEEDKPSIRNPQLISLLDFFTEDIL